MDEIKICDVIIPIPDGPKAISVSGGADSALLLYILLKYSADPIFAFTVAKEENGRAAAITSSNVIEKCIQLSENNKVTHIVEYLDVQTHDSLFRLPIEFYNDKKIVTFYSAVTANPPQDVADSFCGPELNTVHSARDPEVYRDINRNPSYTPFTNINKKKIAELYDHLNITDKLFPYTRSCEAVGKIEFYNHCGKCWWCKERMWGFKRLI